MSLRILAERIVGFLHRKKKHCREETDYKQNSKELLKVEEYSTFWKSNGELEKAIQIEVCMKSLTSQSLRSESESNAQVFSKNWSRTGVCVPFEILFVFFTNPIPVGALFLDISKQSHFPLREHSTWKIVQVIEGRLHRYCFALVLRPNEFSLQ